MFVHSSIWTMNEMTDRNKKRPDSDLNCLRMFFNWMIWNKYHRNTLNHSRRNFIIYILGNDLTCSIDILSKIFYIILKLVKQGKISRSVINGHFRIGFFLFISNRNFRQIYRSNRDEYTVPQTGEPDGSRFFSRLSGESGWYNFQD